MKISVDKDYMASCEGILRIAAIGIGGAIFGTMANSSGYFLTGTNDDAASSHFLMWVSVFAWATTTIIFIFGLLSNPLLAGGNEYRINFFFAVLYLIAAVVYGRFNVEYGPDREPKILVLVYSCVNWLVYVVLFILQLCNSDVGKKMKNRMPAKKTKPGKKADDKVELKEQTDAEAGVSAQVVEDSNQDEPEAEQKPAEQTEQAVA